MGRLVDGQPDVLEAYASPIPAVASPGSLEAIARDLGNDAVLELPSGRY